MESNRTRTEATLGDYKGSAAAADAAEADQSDADSEEGDAAGSDVDPIIVANPNGGAEILGSNDTPEGSTE
jgi:hypothetical protein